MASKAPIKKRAPRTVKEKKFAKEYIANGGNATAAALAVYDVGNSKDPYSTASVIGTENIAKLSFDHYFTSAGLSDEVVAQNITRIALTAKKRDQFSGEITDNDELQLRAMAEAIKIQGKYAPPRAPVDEKGETVRPILAGISYEDVPADESD